MVEEDLVWARGGLGVQGSILSIKIAGSGGFIEGVVIFLLYGVCDF